MTFINTRCHWGFLKAFILLQLLISMQISGCDNITESRQDDSGRIDTGKCRFYPIVFAKYEYEWNDKTLAILGYRDGKDKGCLSRTTVYASIKDFVAEAEVFGLNLATEYNIIDCMFGGPNFLTTRTFDGPRLIASSYKVDDISAELFEYTWETHDAYDRPISGFRKVMFNAHPWIEEWAVTCDRQPVQLTYYDEKRMILKEIFLPEIDYPVEGINGQYDNFHKYHCSSRAIETYYTKYGIVYIKRSQPPDQLDEDIGAPTPPEPQGIFKVCVE